MSAKRVALTAVAVAAAVLGYFGARRLLDRRAAGEVTMRHMLDLAARGDTTALGDLVHAKCRQAGDARKQCYEDVFVALAAEGRVKEALGALSVLAEKDREVEREGHVYTHVIGITAWNPERDVGQVFASCNGLFQSGCYHGVIQAYLTRDADVDSAEVAGICDLIEGRQRNLWLRFQCVHGLGHGLEMIWNWELPRALEGCDWLPSAWDRESCYGGAFMENAVVAMPAHATARLVSDKSAPAAAEGEDHSAHGSGHGSHGPDPSRITFKLIDSTDLLYPCTVVAARYWPSCYRLQGGTIARLVNLDYKKAAKECDRVVPELRTHCYLSLGTYAAGLTVLDARKSIRLCTNGDPAYQPWCFVGATKNFVDVTSRPEDGLELCRQVPKGRNRRQCFVAVGEEISVLHSNNPQERARYCAMAPSEDVEDCNYGAGLLREAPKGLPISPGDTAKD